MNIYIHSYDNPGPQVIRARWCLGVGWLVCRMRVTFSRTIEKRKAFETCFQCLSPLAIHNGSLLTLMITHPDNHRYIYIYIILGLRSVLLLVT